MLDTRAAFRTLSTEWTVPADLPYFEGHFPGRPVFPAVGIVDACVQLVRQQTGNFELQLTEVTSAKFTNPISPQQQVRIVVTGGDGKWNFEWTDQTAPERKFASLTLLLGTA